ncbi:PHP domain-containing protein [Thermoanaerobacterium sp. DL9XJH110]|uniref:PHP domain-containing protein n=1 Tax=Thermoanaerobacterium sp. DL9XJH110 TaxID=3386643 RepID=UPI003BB5E2A1
MKVDLHIHTVFSDGLLTPGQVVNEAHRLNLKAIAITDHDTTDGIPEAVEQAKKFPAMEVIPGIEINSYYNDEEVHILGYYIDYKGSYLKGVLQNLQAKRVKRAMTIVEKLKEMDINVSFENVRKKARGPSIGRPHIAAVLVENGYADSIEDAFEKYLNPGRPAYVPREKLTPFDAVDIIKKAEGIPVLAHPGLLEKKEIIDQLVEYGIMGVEAYHKDHSKQQTDYFIKFASSRGLTITGGSDSHGECPLLLGTVDASFECVRELKKLKHI